jgi:hypothetical protein
MVGYNRGLARQNGELTSLIRSMVSAGLRGLGEWAENGNIGAEVKPG